VATQDARWRLRIKHVTGFTYAGTAYASYNEARMTPLAEPGQTTLFSQLECTPGRRDLAVPGLLGYPGDRLRPAASAPAAHGDGEQPRRDGPASA